MKNIDVIVIGAGIAGASVAAHLAASLRTAIVEMEDRPGYHSTGRSAATYEPNYGPPPMLAFTRASQAFFQSPPEGFADAPLLVSRSSLFLEAEGQQANTAALLAKSAQLDEISPAEAARLFPVLRDGYAKRAFLDTQTGNLDVDLIHRGYLRMFKERGGELLLSAPVTTLNRIGNSWQVTAGQETLSAPIVVNAAGAWGDVVADMAGIARLGLQPKRRSIGVIPAPEMEGVEFWPMATDMGETWYAKPQSGKMIVSSADRTPVEPHDAYADDMAIAVGIERFMEATTVEVTRLDHSWGGLRSFVADGSPAVGFDKTAEGFFWLIGQGGYGIQSCPALSETAACLIRGEPIPARTLEYGLNPAHIAPDRFSNS